METEVKKEEEVVVPETQQSEIADMLDGLIPAPSEQETVVEKEEVQTSGDEGKERSKEEAGEQVEVRGDGKEEGKEVKPEDLGAVSAEEVKKPTEEAQTPPATEQLSELDMAKRELAEMRALMEEMASKTMEPAQKKSLTPEEQKVQKEKAAKQVLTFLKDDETFDEVMKSSVNFNALLTSVVNTAVAKTVQLIPQISNQYIDTQMTTRLAVRDFYMDNPDLLPHKKYVGFVSNELFAKNPDWDLEKNFQETEKEVRTRLKVQRSAGTTQGRQPQTGAGIRTVDANPGFVPSGGSGGRRGSVSTERLSGEDKQIMDLIS